MERAIALDPNQAWGYAMLAKILNDVGKSEEALRLLEKAMRLDPYAYEFLHHLGVAYILTGRVEESIAALKRVLIRNPDFLPTHLVLAMIYMALGQEAEARAAAAEVLRLNPNFSFQVAEQALPVKDQGDFERFLDTLRAKAIAGLKKSLARNPDDVVIRLALVRLYSESGLEEEARGAAAEVLRIDPQFSLEAAKQRFPVKDPVDLEGWLAALRKAGQK
jgi:tetratricopeptide (TPR) repeat protein